MYSPCEQFDHRWHSKLLSIVDARRILRTYIVNVHRRSHIPRKTANGTRLQARLRHVEYPACQVEGAIKVLACLTTVRLGITCLD